MDWLNFDWEVLDRRFATILYHTNRFTDINTYYTQDSSIRSKDILAIGKDVESEKAQNILISISNVYLNPLIE